MLRLAALGIVGAISAAASAEAVMTFNHATRIDDLRRAQVATAEPASAPAPVVQAPQMQAAQGSAAAILKAPDGHYWAEANVNGRAVRFLVDTGATTVALTLADAQRLGFNPGALNYTMQVTTASGQARAAPVRLASVAIAGAQVQNVDALVIENGLQTSLLGMTYLGRLSQFEATRTSLILRP